MDVVEIDGTKFLFPQTFNLLKFIFKNYTTLGLLRKLEDLDNLDWMDYLETISVDLLQLVELNLNKSLVLEYKSYILNNSWNNEFSVRKSCKNIDKAVKFLKLHFGHLEYQQLKRQHFSKLRVVK